MEEKLIQIKNTAGEVIFEHKCVNNSIAKTLKKAVKKNADLIYADLENADLIYADLENADLRYANLENANLTNADLENADLKGANLRCANLENANFRYANLENADLRYANLENADLENADLRYANLENADLLNADLRYANLEDANLLNADLANADLEDANLDYSCIPLSCKSLKAKCDERLRKQIAFHFASLILNGEGVTEQEKAIYENIVVYANEFHRCRVGVEKLPLRYNDPE